MLPIQVHRIRFHRHPVATRFPFRYGIAAMTNLPHLFLRAEVEVGGRLVEGVASEGLPPKWFEKDPATTFEADDLPRMERSIAQAARTATERPAATSFFSFWRNVYDAQAEWAAAQGIGGLLANLGTSLVERAVLDALARASGMPLHRLLRDPALGIDLGAVRPERTGVSVTDVLAAEPLASVEIRHTVGLGDPLTAEDSPERPADDLPFTLEENIRCYGLRYFKIKLGGKADADLERLRRIAGVFERLGVEARFTLDGNEQFHDIASFRSAWETFLADATVGDLIRRGLIFVEQPIHRDHALEPVVGMELRRWTAAPPMIIDEADADLTSLPRALSLGYRGVSHKNCKGIVKGLANAAAVQQAGGILSGEDLANIGPCALLQDLAMMAALGIGHVERNGHHYFNGLACFPAELNKAVLRDHSDLYADRNGVATLAITQGRLALCSVNAAPFGLRSLPDWSVLQEVDLTP